jgi:hypothetical protein
MEFLTWRPCHHFKDNEKLVFGAEIVKPNPGGTDKKLDSQFGPV